MSLEVKRLESIEEANRNQWNNVVDQSELSCVYHRYGWLRAVEEGTGHEPRHLLVSKSGNPIAIFPNFVTDFGPVSRLSSIRPGYGGPVVMTEETEAMELLLEAVPELCEGQILFNEVRTYDQRFIRYHELLKSLGYGLSVLSCRFTLDLTRGWEELFDRMDSERRRGIRRGHDQDFGVHEEELTPRRLSAVYDEYATVMQRAGMETLPRRFFLALRHFDHRLKLFTLSVDGQRRGSYVYLLDEEQSTLQHLFTAVTEEQFEYRTPELLHEHAVKWGIENGYETYDFRGAHADFRDGVYRFKELFGARAVPLLVWERGRPEPALPALNAGRTISDRQIVPETARRVKRAVSLFSVTRLKKYIFQRSP